MLFIAVGGILVIVIFAFAGMAWKSAERVVRPAVERQMAERSSSAVAVVERYLGSAVTDVQLLAMSPALIDAARSGPVRARRLGLTGLGIEELERRMGESRSLQVSAEAERFLADVVGATVFAEVIVTEADGLVAAASGLTTDFVQRDERWWQEAFAGLPNISEVEVDESSGALSVAIAVPLRGGDGESLGALKAVVDIGELRPALAELARGWGYVQLVDDSGRLIVDAHEEHLLEPHPDADALVPGRLVSTVSPDGEELVGMARPALDGRWTVAYWVPKAQAFDLVDAARRAVGIGATIALLTALVGVLIAGTWVAREIGRPVRMVAAAAQRVGGGDLRVRIQRVGKGEVLRLCSAVGDMVERLRELVGSMREAGYHTQSRSQEIAGAVEQLSSGTQEMTATLARLTGEASLHSATIQEINVGMEDLGTAARELATGAETAMVRSRELRELAERNRERLREGQEEVEQMAERSDLATSRLIEFVDASRQFGEFVDVIQQFARRTNLLALNAAIEAARAGGEARGFAVLADEIRKLANQAGEAADRAQGTTDSVLTKLETARQAIGQTREATQAIGSVVDSMDEGFDSVTRAMGEAEGWANRVVEVSADVDKSVQDTAQKLRGVVAGFTDFAAAMEELAAGMEEQNASTEEIAAAVTSLNTAAWELAGLADVFILEQATTSDDGEDEGAEEVDANGAQVVHAAAG